MLSTVVVRSLHSLTVGMNAAVVLSFERFLLTALSPGWSDCTAFIFNDLTEQELDAQV